MGRFFFFFFHSNCKPKELNTPDNFLLFYDLQCDFLVIIVICLKLLTDTKTFFKQETVSILIQSVPKLWHTDDNMTDTRQKIVFCQTSMIAVYNRNLSVPYIMLHHWNIISDTVCHHIILTLDWLTLAPLALYVLYVYLFICMYFVYFRLFVLCSLYHQCMTWEFIHQ